MSKSEAPRHVLVSEGTGFFSRGSCSVCEWTAKGHINDIEIEFKKFHHEYVSVEMAPAVKLVPEPTGDAYADWLEQLIIVAASQKVDFNKPALAFYCAGLGVALAQYRKSHDLAQVDPQVYVADVITRISHLPKRRRAALREPSITRARQQEILNR